MCSTLGRRVGDEMRGMLRVAVEGKALRRLNPPVSSQGTGVCGVLLRLIIIRPFFKLAQVWPRGSQAAAGGFGILAPFL